MNYFILVFERDPLKSYREFHEDLIVHSQVKAWWHFVTSGYLIATEFTAQELSQHADQIFAQHGLPNLHLVLEVNLANHYGRLPKAAWDWIQEQAQNQQAKSNQGEPFP
jgi:hypothetical protein